MWTELERQFLEHSAGKLRQYAGRIETCLGKLDDEQIWVRGGGNENAAGNLVLHLCGNVRQWILSGVGGEPDTRQRDGEFAAQGGIPKADLLGRLRATVDGACEVIGRQTSETLVERREIQKYPVSVMEAIYHVVVHFSMHTGQIIFITKMLTGDDLGFYRHLTKAAAHGEKTP
jgi:uncharacterized damage-inducible protein DinB